MQILKNANFQHNLDYRRLTGKDLPSFVLVPRMIIDGSLKRDDIKPKGERARRGKKKEAMRRAIEKIEASVYLVEKVVSSHQHAGFSLGGRISLIFTLGSPLEPLNIQIGCVNPAKRALAKGKALYSRNQLDQAAFFLEEALNKVSEAFVRLNAFDDEFQLGGARLVTSIKIARDCLIAYFTAGAGVMATAAAESVATGSEHLITHGLKTADGRVVVDHTEEFKALASKMAIKGGTSVAGGFMGKFMKSKAVGSSIPALANSPIMQKQIKTLIAKAVEKELSALLNKKDKKKKTDKETEVRRLTDLIVMAIQGYVPEPLDAGIGELMGHAELRDLVGKIVEGKI